MCTEIPEEDKKDYGGDVVGRLVRGMYGFKDAPNGWQKDWQELLRSDGYDIGITSFALFRCDAQQAKGVVHGDDFHVLSKRQTLDHMAELLKSKCNVRESHRLGFGVRCTQHAHMLNRVVSLGVDAATGKRFVQIELDARHVELVIRSPGLEGASTKSLWRARN